MLLRDHPTTMHACSSGLENAPSTYVERWFVTKMQQMGSVILSLFLFTLHSRYSQSQTLSSLTKYIEKIINI
jgi:regulator of sirC expression with transglutaminase-like and TPR domain